MSKLKKRTLGHIVTDARVPLPYRKASQEAGWYVLKVKEIHSESSDSQIAEIYGKNRAALLTTDKTAYTHNTENGFIGYICIDGKVSPEEESEYLEKFKQVISTLDKRSIEGYIVTIDKKRKSIGRNRLLRNKRK